MESGGDINQKNIFGQTPLHSSITNYLSSGPKKDPKNFLFFKFLMDNGADINIRASNGVTPLMTTVHRKASDTLRYVSLLLERNPSSLNDIDKFGRTVLHHCVLFSSEPDVFQKIINSGINRDIADVNGKKAVYYTQFLHNSRKRFQESLGKQNENPGYQQYKLACQELGGYFKKNGLSLSGVLEEVSTKKKPTTVRGFLESFVIDKKVLRFLHETPGIGSVRNITESSVIDKKVEELMIDISKFMSESL